MQTRKELEAALMAAAWAYYLKGGKLEYCSQEVTRGLNKYYGATYRLTEDAAPEYGTSHTTIYSVCSDYVYKVYYEALGYRMFGSPNYLDAVTSAYWLFGEKVALFRWMNPKYTLTEQDIAYGVTTEKQLNTQQAREFMANWKENLRPGDVIVATGHAMLYIGGGYVVDCRGKKYDEKTGLDDHEPEGAVHFLHTVEGFYLDGTDAKTKKYVLKDDSKLSWFVVFRPLDGFVASRCEADPGMDAIDMTVTVPTVSRMRYPGIEIDRTVDITPYGTAVAGAPLGYRVAITNRSNEEDYLRYCRCADAAYAGSGYQGLQVTERVPEGTELIAGSVSHGGVCADGVITWTVDLAPGASIALTYQVRVTGAVGSRVISEGGFVADIPSNRIITTVGGNKLSEAACAGLRMLADTPADSWQERYQISPLATDLEFARQVYAGAMGIGLALPSVQEFLAQLFDYSCVTVPSGSVRYQGSMTADLFTRKGSAACGPVEKLLVPGYYGGQLLYSPVRGLTMNDFSFAYLEPGDILVYASADPTGKVQASDVMVYAGSGRLLCRNSRQETSVLACAVEDNSDPAYGVLWHALMQDLFFLLRPTLACGDIQN